MEFLSCSKRSLLSALCFHKLKKLRYTILWMKLNKMWGFRTLDIEENTPCKHAILVQNGSELTQSCHSFLLCGMFTRLEFKELPNTTGYGIPTCQIYIKAYVVLVGCPEGGYHSLVLASHLRQWGKGHPSHSDPRGLEHNHTCRAKTRNS